MVSHWASESVLVVARIPTSLLHKARVDRHIDRCLLSHWGPGHLSQRIQLIQYVEALLKIMDRQEAESNYAQSL